jgi:hypothetical protein
MNANLSTLPVNVVAEVKELVKWFPIAHIVFRNGKHEVSPNISLSNQYAEDDQYLGSVNNTDIYTEQEIDEFIKQM